MVRIKRLKKWPTLALLCVGSAITACTPVAPTVKQVAATISCEQAQQNNYATVSDQRMVQFLDQSVSDDNLQQCWKPTMAAALQQQREIPQHHLVNALKAFNQRADRQLFHLAVSQYLTSLSMNDYHTQQRRLLVAYSRYLIDHVQSNSDPRLAEMKVLCARLDQDLYRKLFE